MSFHFVPFIFLFSFHFIFHFHVHFISFHFVSFRFLPFAQDDLGHEDDSSSESDNDHDDNACEEPGDGDEPEDESSESSDNDAASPSPGRMRFEGVERVDSQPEPLGDWPAEDREQKRLKEFWGKFVVPKFGSKDGVGGDEEEPDDEGDALVSAHDHDSEPDASSQVQESDGGESDSGASSKAVPCGSRGPDLPSMEPGLPLCLQHGKWESCLGENCENCCMVAYDISQGNLHCYDDTDSDGSVWESSFEPNERFDQAMLEKSTAAHIRSLKATPADATTLHTPDCPQPDFFGFPLVPTPPRLAKSAPKQKEHDCL